MAATIEDRFKCQIDMYSEMWTRSQEELVTNEMCGCTYLKTNFEGAFRAQTSRHILDWDFNKAGTYRCRSNYHERPILKGRCEVGDLVNNRHYHTVWEKYKDDKSQTFRDLTGGACDSHFTALVPLYLRTIYIAKMADDKLPEVERVCIHKWVGQVKNSAEREEAYQEEWGLFQRTYFVARCIYHSIAAIIFEVAYYALSFVVAERTCNAWREADVGDRIADLYMEYYGCPGDGPHSNTLENRLIRWVWPE